MIDLSMSSNTLDELANGGSWFFDTMDETFVQSQKHDKPMLLNVEGREIILMLVQFSKEL